MSITLEEAKKLIGIEDWDLNPWEEDFFIKSTRELLKEHPPEWFREFKWLLQDQLKWIFEF